MELDNNVAWNKHDEHFSQFADILVDTHKLYTIEDIASLKPDKLAAISRMEFVIASHMIHYATKDVAYLEHLQKAQLSH